MSALDDFVMGTSPQINRSACTEARIGYDRVWRVAVEMFHVMRPGGNIFISYDALATRVGTHPRNVRTAIKVLERSEVITTEEGFFKHGAGISRHRRPTWTPSVGRRLNLDVRDIDIDAAEAAQSRLGVDRAWRVAVMAKALVGASVDVLSRVTGIVARQVRAALGAAGMVAGKVSGRRWRLRRKTTKAPKRAAKSRTDPRREKTLKASTFSSSFPPGTQKRARTRAWVRPVHRWYLKCFHGGKLMPDDLYNDYVKDDSMVPVRHLRQGEVDQIRNLVASKNRWDRPAQTWSPMDSAKEFKTQYLDAFPDYPGDVGNLVTLAKVLGSMRRRHGHDARLELEVLNMWLGDYYESTWAERRGYNIPPWKLFVKAIGKFYAEADDVVAGRNGNELNTEPYETLSDRHYRTVVAPEQERQQKEFQEASAASEEAFWAYVNSRKA